jgi:hypothetical protein
MATATQAEIDALEAAMKSGVLRVRFADRDITYRSQSEMAQQLKVMKDQFSGAPSSGPRFSQASFSEPYGT